MDCIFDWFHVIQERGQFFGIVPFFYVLVDVYPLNLSYAAFSNASL